VFTPKEQLPAAFLKLLPGSFLPGSRKDKKHGVNALQTN
jgi:hypothetical protein